MENEKWYVIPRDKKKGDTLMFSGSRKECTQYVERNWPSKMNRYDYLPGEGTVVSARVLEIRRRNIANQTPGY